MIIKPTLYASGTSGDAYAGRFLLFAILLDVVYRSFSGSNSSWDLLAIVMIGGGISTFYQIKNKILLNDSNIKNGLFYITAVALISAIVAFIVAIIL